MILFVDENSGILFIKIPAGLVEVWDFIRIRSVRFSEYIEQYITAKENDD